LLTHLELNEGSRTRYTVLYGRGVPRILPGGRGVPRGDAQDARASPLPPLCIPPPPGHVHPPQPERLVRKDEAVGNKKKKCKFFYLNIIIN
jgi:hypothetical protein